MRELFALAAISLALGTRVLAQGESPERVYKAVGARASAPAATIAYGPSPLQVADLRLPPGPGPFPVAVVIHGGCWMASVDKRQGIAGFADALTARGFATWNIEYRRVGDAGGGYPGSFEDVAAAVDKLLDIAPAHRLDLTRVTIIGHSAGAHFALWAASREKVDGPLRSSKVRPVSVVAIDGPGALAPFVGIDAKICGQPVIVPLMGGTPSERPTEYRIATPQERLPFGLTQLLIMGELGDIMEPYIAAAKASGDSVLTLTPLGANHFDVVTPTTPNGKAVVSFIVNNAIPKR